MINQENTYLGADGLAYCKICGEPVCSDLHPETSLIPMYRYCHHIRRKLETIG